MSPSVRSKSRGIRAIIVALIILLAATAVALWVLRETLDKGEPGLPTLFSEGNGNTVGQALKSLQGRDNAVGQALRSLQGRDDAVGRALRSLLGSGGERVQNAAPEPAPLTTPASPPAEIPAPQDTSQMLMPFSPVEGNPAPPPAEDASDGDAVVPPAFIDDLAKFLAENYWPKGTHPAARTRGASTVSLKWANLRYGAELRGLPRQGDDPLRIRSAILDYALNASTVDRLYGIYAERFITALNSAATEHKVGPKGRERGLTPEEIREMFTIYAMQSRMLATALRTYAGDPEMPGRVQTLLQAEQEVYAANLAYLDSMAEYERVRDSRNRETVRVAQNAMDAAAKEYQQRIQFRGRAEEGLGKAMAASPAARAFGDDSLVYCAAWAYRRGNTKTPALHALAKILNDMSSRLKTAQTP